MYSYFVRIVKYDRETLLRVETEFSFGHTKENFCFKLNCMHVILRRSYLVLYVLFSLNLEL